MSEASLNDIVSSVNATWLVTGVSAVAITLLVFWHKFSLASRSSPIVTTNKIPTSETARLNVAKGPFDMGEVRVSKILVHPIKSCRGTSVSEVRYTPIGIENDRKWCIIDAQDNKIITAREIAKMVLIEPRLDYDSSSPFGGELIVTVPNHGANPTSFRVPIEPTTEILTSWTVIDKCSLFGVVDIDGYICQSSNPRDPSPSEILSNYMGKAVHLVMKGPRARPCDPTPLFPSLEATGVFQDGYPLLVASEESLAAVGSAIRDAANGTSQNLGKIGGMDRDQWKDGNIEIERFRPNIVLAGAGIPFAEDAWKKITIGNKHSKDLVSISLVSKCTRCLLPNVDVKTGVRDAAVPYKIMMKIRTGVDADNMNKACFGCNGVPSGSGIVRVGDAVHVQEWIA